MDERLIELLGLFGLPERESRIFLHLTRNGPSGAGDVAPALDIPRMEAYRLLKKMLDKGLVSSTLGKPVKYHAESLEALTSLLMSEQGQYLKRMQGARPELEEAWKRVASAPGSFEENRFRIIQGREQIYAAISKMVSGASTSVEAMMTRNDLAQADLVGLSDEFARATKRGAIVRLSTFIDAMTLVPARTLAETVEVKHSEEAAKSRLVLADGTQTLVSIVLDDSQGMKNERDVAIWTDSKDYAGTMGNLFQNSFAGATPAETRIMVVSGESLLGRKVGAVLNVLSEAVAEAKWSVNRSGKLKGASGREFEFTAVLTGPNNETVGLDIIAADREHTVSEKLSAAALKKLDMQDSRLAVVSIPLADESSQRLAEFLGIKVVDGSDVMEAASAIRKFLTRLD